MLIPSASDDAISLISSLCSWDPHKRPTAAEVLQHPFFQSCFYVPPSLRPRVPKTPPSGMPTLPDLYADDLNSALKKKHEMGTYKSMVIYLEACESGSIFEGLLPDDINIYATTAANAKESSWATYCPGDEPAIPEEYWACLGDLYSVSWMEDSDKHNLRTESLEQQYSIVKTRTSDHNTYDEGSHVMQYGNLEIDANQLFLYIGSNPANDNASFIDDNTLPSFSKAVSVQLIDFLYLGLFGVELFFDCLLQVFIKF